MVKKRNIIVFANDLVLLIIKVGRKSDENIYDNFVDIFNFMCCNG